MRFFQKRSQKSKIYDHAGGHLILEEAGGRVTDLDGKRIDLSQGRTLVANYGFIAARPEIHTKALEAIKSLIE